MREGVRAAGHKKSEHIVTRSIWLLVVAAYKRERRTAECLLLDCSRRMHAYTKEAHVAALSPLTNASIFLVTITEAGLSQLRVQNAKKCRGHLEKSLGADASARCRV
jgi:hypothetical protein